MKSTRHPPYAFRRQAWSVAALACACVLTSTVALGSGSEHDHDRARRAVQSGEILPLQTLLERVQGVHPGQVLELELERDGGRCPTSGCSSTPPARWSSSSRRRGATARRIL